jgi:hypothetical protein
MIRTQIRIDNSPENGRSAWDACTIPPLTVTTVSSNELLYVSQVICLLLYVFMLKVCMNLLRTMENYSLKSQRNYMYHLLLIIVIGGKK